MKNQARILFHTVSWYLSNNEIHILDEYWEQSIKDFIYQGYKQGSFVNY